MSINIPLQAGFPLTPESASEQAKLQAQIDNLNSEQASIEADEAALKATPDSEWNASHTKGSGKIRERKLELLHNEMAVRQAADAFFRNVMSVDFPAAKAAAHKAVEDAKAAATAHLVAGGWTDGQINDGHGANVAGIDLHVLIRNDSFRKATLELQSLSLTNVRETKAENLKASDAAKGRSAAAKSKAMALAV